MRIPKVTLLQWFVFNQLLDGEQSTEKLRTAVRQAGVSASVPAFQQLLGRLETAGYLRGRYQRGTTEGRAVRYRVYRLTRTGRQEWVKVRHFVCVCAA